jgi:hypothetical protein
VHSHGPLTIPRPLHQQAEKLLSCSTTTVTPSEVLGYIHALGALAAAYSIRAHIFMPSIVRRPADFQSRIAYVDFLKYADTMVARAIAAVTGHVQSSGKSHAVGCSTDGRSSTDGIGGEGRGGGRMLLDVDRLTHTQLIPLVVSYGHTMGDQTVVADAAISATLAHGHMPLEQAADMLWALGMSIGQLGCEGVGVPTDVVTQSRTMYTRVQVACQCANANTSLAERS